MFEFIDNDPNKSFAHLLDCEGPSVYERRWNDLLKYIIDEIVASLEKNFSKEIEPINGHYKCGDSLENAKNEISFHFSEKEIF